MAEPEPVKVFCRGCHAKLDVSDLEPFSFFPCPDCGTRLRVPKRFDRYLLEKICGYGGMSKVYRAIEPELARRVAVKILNPGSEADDGGTRFLAEARLVARVNHPGIIPIYNCGVFEAQPFLVMRYMESGSLEQWQMARLLARRAGTQSRQMSNIAAQLHQQAKQLSTAYFLQSGVRYWPVAQLTRPRMTTYVGGLRQLYQRGQALTEEFHSCRSHAATQDLAQLYAQLAQAGAKRCAQLRQLLDAFVG